VNRIESYQFGQVVINGKTYDADVIVFPDRVRADWKRRSSHKLSLEDAGEIFAVSPEILVVGSGAYGRVQVLPEVAGEADARDVRLIVQPTAEACEIYNRLAPVQRTVAALHLTC